MSKHLGKTDNKGKQDISYHLGQRGDVICGYVLKHGLYP